MKADALGWAVFCVMAGVMITVFWREHTEEERAMRSLLSNRISRIEDHIGRENLVADPLIPVARATAKRTPANPASA